MREDDALANSHVSINFVQHPEFFFLTLALHVELCQFVQCELLRRNIAAQILVESDKIRACKRTS